MTLTRQIGRVSSAFWQDHRFARLPSPLPNSRYLYWFLRTGPFNDIVPGLYVAHAVLIADALGWAIEAFYDTFAECWRSMLVDADFDAGLIFVIDATADDPWHINQRKGWGVAIDKLPDCELRTVAREAVLSRGKSPIEIYSRWRSTRFTEPHSTSVNLSEPHSTSVNLTEGHSKNSTVVCLGREQKSTRECRGPAVEVSGSESVKLDTLENRETHVRAHTRGRTRGRVKQNCNNLNPNSDHNTNVVRVPASRLAPEPEGSGTSAIALAPAGKGGKASRKTKASAKAKPTSTRVRRSIAKAREMRKGVPTLRDDRPSSPELFSLPPDERKALYDFLASEPDNKPDKAKRRELLERVREDVLRVYLNFRLSVSSCFAYSNPAKAIELGEKIGLGCIGNGMTPEQYLEWWRENDYTSNSVPTLAFLAGYANIDKAAANLLAKGKRSPRKRAMREVSSGTDWQPFDDDLAALEASARDDGDGAPKGGAKENVERRPRKKKG